MLYREQTEQLSDDILLIARMPGWHDSEIQWAKMGTVEFIIDKI